MTDPAAPDLIVIPARWGSTRLPGKPLVPIAGRTLLARVVDVARRAVVGRGDVAIVVATDDTRIADHAATLGVACVLTGQAITTGSGRALAAAQAQAAPPAVVLNLQGDAPFVRPETVAAMLDRVRTGAADVVTPVVVLGWEALDRLRAHKQVAPFSGTSCIAGADGRALWFSKTIIPAIRDEAVLRAAGPLSPVRRHIGLYAYRLAALARFEAAGEGAYERLEGLEQLRLLELGMRIDAIEVAPARIDMSGIDTPADVALAERLIAAHGDPSDAPWPG